MAKKEKAPAKTEKKEAAKKVETAENTTEKAEKKERTKAPHRPLKEVYDELYPLLQEFNADAHQQITKNNAAAGRRARKTSGKLRELLKEFRAASNDFSRKNLE